LGPQDAWAHANRKFIEVQRVSSEGKTGRAYIALKLICKLYGVERDLVASYSLTFDAKD
jgi:flagellar biosynthesis regulator FlbT